MKPGTEQDILQACQAHLRALQPVRKVEVRYRTIRRERPEATAELILETEMGRLSYFYEIKRSLSLPRLEHVLLQFERDSSEAESRPLLLADYLPPRLAERLVEAGVNFVDKEGNIYIHWPGKLYIHLQGARPKRPPEASASRLLRRKGLQVAFVLLVEPRAASMPYRELGKASGVALGSVAHIMQELKEKGYLEQKGPRQWRLTERRKLLEIWLDGYSFLLRPKLLVDRFQPPEQDLDQTLTRLRKEIEARGMTWALTGGFAADLLTRHFRGNQLGLFVSEWPGDITKDLKWLPSPSGPVTVFRQFSPLVLFSPKQTTEVPVAHPLLVYAELIFQGRERELETAKLISDRYLAPLTHGD